MSEIIQKRVKYKKPKIGAEDSIQRANTNHLYGVGNAPLVGLYKGLFDALEQIKHSYKIETIIIW